MGISIYSQDQYFFDKKRLLPPKKYIHYETLLEKNKATKYKKKNIFEPHSDSQKKVISLKIKHEMNGVSIKKFQSFEEILSQSS